jgi:hypothetical protein
MMALGGLNVLFNTCDLNGTFPKRQPDKQLGTALLTWVANVALLLWAWRLYLDLPQ